MPMMLNVKFDNTYGYNKDYTRIYSSDSETDRVSNQISINIATLSYPHFYFAIGNLLYRKQLVDLFSTQECIEKFGYYHGGKVSEYGYPTHGVHFRLSHPEKIEEFIKYMGSVIKLPSETAEDITEFMIDHYVYSNRAKEKKELSEVNEQIRQLMEKAAVLQQSIGVPITSAEKRLHESVERKEGSVKEDSIVTFTPGLSLHTAIQSADASASAVKDLQPTKAVVR